MSRARPIAGLGLLALVGCTSFYTEIDEPQVCQTLSNQQVPGVPANTVHGVAVPLALNIHKELGSTAGVTGEVEVLQVVLHADSGVTDFGFLQSAEVDLLVPSTGGGSVPVVQYHQPASYQPSSSLTMPGNGANVFDDVTSGVVSATLALTGDLPTSAWSADIEVCVEIRLDE